MWKQMKIIYLLCFCYQTLSEIIRVQPDDACELKVNSSSTEVLSINNTWTNVNKPCMLYKCIRTSDGEIRIETVQLKCSTSCSESYIYKTLPGECCGTCAPTFCKYGESKFKIGEIWKSSDNCTINECIDKGSDVVVMSYKKSCPILKNCPEDNTEIRDCCPYCNYRAQRFLQQYGEIEITDREFYRVHPCLRDCVKGQQLTCFYEFVVEEFQTMSKACYNCPFNETDCYRPHCVSADGMKRSITVVNRMMPGPSIEVCVNDTIIVDVKNRLMSEGTTIHWHGLHQKKTYFMDGVPHISQCPIPPGHNFRYNFNADNPGTHFWHSHLGMQRGDGLFGAIIVRNHNEPHEKLYDFDLSEHTIITNDWTHMTGTAVFTAHHHGGGDNKPPNILINGRGKYRGNLTFDSEQKMRAESKIVEDNEKPFLTTTFEPTEEETSTTFNPNENVNEEDLSTTEKQKLISTFDNHTIRIKRGLAEPNKESPLVPYEVFTVLKGRRYRFRHINAGFLNCPIELSIDNHTITAIASDGNNLEPIEATFLVTYAGERWDFIINTDQEVGSYYIRARGLMDCDERFTSSFQMAVLYYHGTPDENPRGEKPSYNLSRKGLTLNALNKPNGQKESLTVAEMKSVEMRPNNILKTEPDFKFYLSYDFYGKDNPLFHVSNLYGFNQATFGKVYTPQINHITMKMPQTPAMLAKGLLDSTFCNETALIAQGINCQETFCECTHVLQVRLNSVVELILIDEGFTYDANHMFHMHGHYFHVVGMDRLGKNVTRKEVKELDKLGRLKRRFADSVKKDTCTVPDGGYTIIRFYADNPGMWLLHCHIDFHAEVGMALILKVGDYNQMASPPRNFPQCFDFVAQNIPDSINSSSFSLKINIYSFVTFVISILFHSINKQ